ncbi:MAG: type II toxin-antitoxin system RelE/ParE family toxin [Flavobacteriaceae bacterium]|nr:type II toxin-antitoxin system RelE/ParE family toxin [Flavobacteriaceae bacterium]MCY4267146.1 type II toxin-antitoxin system RelE/ParE family toxin [Flavobacteriaceae bacterium]MCY4297927.1 type II toxin-antitoxin system RelE/ParE family toxin [Flavobacteriaceae bacterium]
MLNFEVNFLIEVRDFFLEIDSKARKKLIYNINKAKQTNDSSIFCKLKNSEIWEFKAKMKNEEYRIFAFWDINQKALVICTHGIIKKTQKIPKKELDKAKKIRKHYLAL